ncbi:MAG: penicillin-binding protein 1A [Rickettsiaceae bacterium]|nr:penicillin-binding protein 1A [Rickettsiaceae bacterium]
MLRFIILSIKLCILCGFIGIGVATYVIYTYSRDLPDYSQLKDYYPPSVTRMYSADGKLMEEYAKEHRIFVPINNIPKILSNAFVAGEDKNFYQHVGIDILSIVRAAIRNFSNVLQNRRGRGLHGGSTITQQVVKNFLLSSEKSYERKIKEAILSYMVTQVFTKDEILELYLNQIYLGTGAYGVAVAALTYFNKSVEELTLNEAAVLASMPKSPSRFDPEKNYDRVKERRDYIIGRMYSDGYITKTQAKKAIAEPIILHKPDKVQTITADYYAEQVRKEVIDMFGKEYFYTAGLTIITCLDSEAQKHAAGALRRGIVKIDRKKGFRKAITNISLDNWKQQLNKMKPPPGIREYDLAVVLNVTKLEAKIGLKDGDHKTLKLKDMKWTRTNIKSVKTILDSGDIIAVRKKKNNKDYELAQIPVINGAIMVMEPKSGKVIAAEGGYDFSVSKFDRTTQAIRQPGSLIKSFVYLAALENGGKPTDLYEDSQVEIEQGPGLPLWRPKNHNSKFLGTMTMRSGLEKSINMVTIRAGQFAGFNKVAEVVKRFGINDDPEPFPSITLGAMETTLSKIITAYGVFINKGRSVTPHYIELIKDRNGHIIYKRDYSECAECNVHNNINDTVIMPPTLPKKEEHIITDEATSYQIISILNGALHRGTSRKAQILNKIIAGKTGTSNEGKDTWYIGMTPNIVVGTYVGYDRPKSIGRRQFGATVCLPIFIDFMQNAYEYDPSIPFEVPDSIQLVAVDPDTGEPSTADNAIIEAFKIEDYNQLFKPLKYVPKTIDEDPFLRVPSDQSHEVY